MIKILKSVKIVLFLKFQLENEGLLMSIISTKYARSVKTINVLQILAIVLESSLAKFAFIQHLQEINFLS